MIINVAFMFKFDTFALESNPNSDYDLNTFSCGTVQGIPNGVAILTRNIVTVIKLLIPVILIVLGIIDFLKASAANDDKVSKEAVQKFIRRIISAVLVFFVVTFVQFIVRTISNSANETSNQSVENTAESILSCISCFISSASSCNPDNYLELTCENFEFKFPLTVDSKEYKYDESKKLTALNSTTDLEIAKTCGVKN